jgi:hypothetical protein
MLETFQDRDYDGSTFTAYRVTDKGMAWLFANQDKLTLKEQPLVCGVTMISLFRVFKRSLYEQGGSCCMSDVKPCPT